VKNAGKSKKPSAKAAKPAAKKTNKAPAKPAPRADFGAPIDQFFARQPPELRPLCQQLRALIEEAAPDAVSSLKWGMPVFTVGGTMMCAIGAHKAHVNLILAGPPGTYADPEGRLEGEGKTGRHLKLRSLAELPREAVRRWLRVAVQVARGQTR